MSCNFWIYVFHTNKYCNHVLVSSTSFSGLSLFRFIGYLVIKSDCIDLLRGRKALLKSEYLSFLSPSMSNNLKNACTPACSGYRPRLNNPVVNSIKLIEAFPSMSKFLNASIVLNPLYLFTSTSFSCSISFKLLMMIFNSFPN